MYALKRSSTYLASVVAVLTLTMTGCAAPNAGTPNAPAPSGDTNAIPAKPSTPVSLHILDTGGDQKLTGPMVDAFVKEFPDIISSVTWESAGPADTVATIKPQVDSNNLSVDLVMTGMDGLFPGIVQGLWIPLAKDYSDRLSNMKNYIEPAAKMEELSEGFGIVTSYMPSGPMLQYDPAIVTDVPKTPEALLAWAKANPGKFGYARPASSGPGLSFLEGLPYILGDKDPKDPVNGWEKTWKYLTELGQYIDNYPTGTGQVMTNMSDGTWSMTPITTGWDVNPRAIGTEPEAIESAPFDNFTFVTDAHFAAVPKGQSADKVSAILLLLQFMLTPDVNAMAYDAGYFYPGPSVKGATLDKAPQASQDIVNKFGRDWIDDVIAKTPKATPLVPDQMVKAFDLWDRQIGVGKVSEK